MIPSTKWSGLGWTKRVLWPLRVGIIIAADEFHISNKGKILNRASVQRLGGIRKTINPHVLGLEQIGRESQGVGPLSPSTTTVPCITNCFGVQLPVQRMRTTKHRVQKKLRDLHPGPLQNHYIPRLPHTCEVPACATTITPERHCKGTPAWDVRWEAPLTSSCLSHE